MSSRVPWRIGGFLVAMVTKQKTSLWLKNGGVKFSAKSDVRC